MEAKKYKQSEGRWSLFRNLDKKTEESPEFSGTLTLNGVDYKLNGWVNEYGDRKYFAGTIRSAIPLAGDEDIPI